MLVDIPPISLHQAEFLGALAVSNMLIDANGEKAAIIFQPPKTGTITHLAFRTGNLTTSDTLAIRGETVSASGEPSGSLWATNTSGSQASLVANTWYEVALTAGIVVTDVSVPIAFVIALPASGAVGNMNIARVNVPGGGSIDFPYALLYTGSWAKSASQTGLMAVKYSDGTRPPVLGVAQALYVNNAYSSSSNPNERGNKIVLPFTAKIKGVWHHPGSAVAGDFSLNLLDSANAVLQTVTVDGDYNNASNPTVSYHQFPGESIIQAGATIRVTKKPTSATNVAMYDATAPISGQGLAGLPMGAYTCLTTRQNAGAWTDSTDTQAKIGLIISALGTDGVSARAYAV